MVETVTIGLPELRAKLDQAIAAEDVALSRALMAELWSAYPGPASAPVVLSGFRSLERLNDSVKAKSLKISVLRSFSVEPAVPILKAAALLNHINLQVMVGEFNTYAQDILSPDSPAYLPDTDLVTLAVQTRDIAPDLWQGDKVDGTRVQEVINEFEGLIKAFRARSHAYLVIHNLEQPALAVDGVLDAQSVQSQREAIYKINSGLVKTAAKYSGVHILDYEGLVSRHGRARWSDESRWLTMRLPVAMENLHHLADEWLKFLVPVAGRTAKALIVDLDNTLWGGVLGEDGPDGINLDGEYPGAAYQAVQRALLDLSRRGVILGICSKNDEHEALKVIKDHPGMLVKPEDFAVFKINWQEKASNIKSIAEELNIATDAIAFLDDNAAERLWVRQSLPEVHVIELTDDPLTYADALRTSPAFERLTLSGEDKERNRHYGEQRQRTDLQSSVASLEDFYRSLEMRLDVFSISAKDVPRVAQLTQKTNQFNLTTRRYSEADIERLLDTPGHMMLAARVTDRFGDSGIIAVAIIDIEETQATLDTFLMSCRVIGRTLETAILAIITQKLENRGVATLIGHFVPTEKNGPAKNFLAEHGFKEGRDKSFAIKLPDLSLKVPSWVSI